MTPYRIIKTFKGSQTGNDYSVFRAGTERELSDDLALLAVSEGWAEPITTAHTRDTKVIIPMETKIVMPEEHKSEEKPPKTLKLARKA